MMFKKRFLMVFMSLTLLVGMMGGGNVSAANRTDWTNPDNIRSIYKELRVADEPEIMFAALPVEVQNAIIADMQQINVIVVESPIVMLTETLGVADTTVQGISHLGEWCWSYEQTTWFYYDGSVIVGVPYVEIRGSTALFWSYEGIKSESDGWGPGDTWYKYYSQGHFKIGIGWLTDNDYPWIRHTVYGDGSKIKQWGIS